MMYKPIGGVKSVSLCFATQTDKAATVPIIDDSSYYNQSVSADNAAVVVEHSLTLLARRADCQMWMNTHFVERAILEGFVATVCLNDGREFVLGSAELPLRLSLLTQTSGKSLSDTPTVTLTLKCENSTLID